MDNVELLFFDTFSHDISEELNLDLVQFPKPVYISEVRIIPLGARVQADFPGGVRLGATNPSQFEIEFFVNDLSKPGASTFESLGGLEYKQNVHIQLECERKQIPTDGLVLRGWYTTITLAVYGSLTKSLSNPQEIASASATAAVPVGSSEQSVEIVPKAPEPQPDWYFENPAPVPTVNQETCEPPVPSPTIQPIQTVEPTPRVQPVEPAKPAEPPRWSGEEAAAPAVAAAALVVAAVPAPPPPPLSVPQKPTKRPSSPPSESLVSLSPESISAEEEEDRVEREVEEATAVVEPFEPILSDEELMADDVPPLSIDYQCETVQADNLYAIKPPDLLELEKLTQNIFQDGQNNDDIALEKVREIVRSLAKSTANFHQAPGQEKETFVHNCESLCSLLGSVTQLESEDLRDWAEIVNASLDLDLARGQPQPAYKVRHVKVGVRLAEASCSLVGGPEILLKVDAPRKLLTLCMRENVALPVKLAALRALDASLQSPAIVEEFLKTDNNLYRLTLEMLDEAKLARLKYSLTSVLRKIHVYELLEESVNNSGTISELSLNELTQTYVCAPTLMAQPKRQLPASRQMEFEREQARNPRRHLISYFEHHGLLRRLLLVLASPNSDKRLIAATRRFITRLADTGEGLLYLLREPEISRSILRAMRYEKPGSGCNLAWRLQVVQCLASLKNPQSGNSTLSNDWWLPLRKLHTFLIYPEGLRAVVAVLPLYGFIDTLTPYLGDPDLGEFVAEIISVTVRYSERVEIFQNRASTMIEETRESGTLRDVLPHLTIAGQTVNWNYGDVTSLVGVVRTYSERAASLPGELLTACRILRYLVFPSNADTDPIESYVELKHRNALTQLFAADGLTTLVTVLTRVANFYEQPHVHRASLTGRRGMALVALLLPCVKLVRALLEHLVKSMATDFKDLTAVAPLLGVWALVDAIPGSTVNSSLRNLSDEIAETLLAFTRAVDSDGAGNVAKSLWTQMIGEVLKMISACPANFLPGLRLLSRLLPPILQLDDDHPSEEVTRALGLRKLWSAHLQAQAGNLTDTLRLLCASWDETLLNLLSNVCKQISDLAAPSALVVGRCILDRILGSTPLESNLPVLSLLADLSLHAPVKATLLTLLSPTSRAQVKSDQKYPPVVEMMCATLKTTSSPNVQIEILDTFRTLCDDKLSLVKDDTSNNEPFELRLTHSVPSKDPLLSILAALIDITANAGKYTTPVLETVLRILLSLTSHNYGLYHVKSCLENNPGALGSLLEHVSGKIDTETVDNQTDRGTLELLIVSFLESLLSCNIVERSLYLRVAQLASLITWGAQHPLERIKGAEKIVEQLRTSVDGKDDKDPVPEMLEPLLPTPEALLNQFSQRSLGNYGKYSGCPRKRNFIVTPETTGGNESTNTVDLLALAAELLPPDFNLISEAQLLCSKVPPDDSTQPMQPKGQNEGPEDPRDSQKQTNVPTTKTKQPFVTPMRGRAQFVNSMRGGQAVGGAGRGADPFRSRPPNTSRPPSLHVDDFVALETCGAQPTGPTGYNKLSIRGTCPPRGVIAGTRCRSWVSEPRSPYLR